MDALAFAAEEEAPVPRVAGKAQFRLTPREVALVNRLSRRVGPATTKPASTSKVFKLALVVLAEQVLGPEGRDDGAEV